MPEIKLSIPDQHWIQGVLEKDELDSELARAYQDLVNSNGWKALLLIGLKFREGFLNDRLNRSIADLPSDTNPGMLELRDTFDLGFIKGVLFLLSFPQLQLETYKEDVENGRRKQAD